jgi:predicted nucleic acid-binding protein
MSFVVLDTDVASAALRGRLPDRLLGRFMAISLITLGELAKWTAVRSWGPRRLSHMEAWRRDVVILPMSEAVAYTWGELQARAQHRGRPRPVNDSWIAACCLVERLPLATFNLKDFADFAEHEGLDLVPVSPR